MNTIKSVTKDLLPFSWNPLCPVRIQELRLVEFQHINFEQEIKQGNFIVQASISESLLQIMDFAFSIRFPIHSALLIDAFKGNDDLSMSANNSSAFNFRPIAGTSIISLHSLGLAVDINPLFNPYLRTDSKWVPHEGLSYVNRKIITPGMFTSDHPLVDAFKHHGFEWGGNWERPDYHHFQKEKL